MVIWLLLAMMLVSVIVAARKIYIEYQIRKHGGEAKSPIRDKRLRNRRR